MARLNGFFLALLVALVAATTTHAFGVLRPRVVATTRRMTTTSLQMSSENQDDDPLRKLGYTEDEIRRSQKESDREEINVRVDLIQDVDPISLTAIGFGLIALNFFVFANMEDGGIASIIATVINTLNQ
jgi:hypothetical protein